MSNKPLTKEQKARISEGVKKFYTTPEGQAKRAGMIGQTPPYSWAAGHIPWNKGKTGTCTRSPEAKSRISQANSKPVNQFTLTGEFIKTWPSVISAADTLGIGYTGLCLCAKGRTKSSGGFRWHYA